MNLFFILHFFKKKLLAILIVCKIMRRTFSDKLTAVTEMFLFSYSFSRLKAYYTLSKIVYYLMGNILCISGPVALAAE